MNDASGGLNMEFLKKRLEENTSLKKVSYRRSLNGKEAITLSLPRQAISSRVSQAAQEVGFKVGKVDPAIHLETRRDDFHVFTARQRFSIFVSPQRYGSVKIIRNGELQSTLRDRQKIVKFFNALTQK